MQRIVVIGTSGSGKTTLARAIAEHLRVPHIELDAVHWKPNWISTPAEEMLPIVDRLTSAPAWTCCGNYSKVRDVVWSRADTIIWLDYPMRVVFMRVLQRTLTRWWSQQELMERQPRAAARQPPVALFAPALGHQHLAKASQGICESSEGGQI